MHLVLTAILIAHNYWILPSKFSVSPGETVRLEIKGGHRFPEGDASISQKMVRVIRVIRPDGREDTLEPQLNTSYVPVLQGAYKFIAELGPKRLKRPKYVLYAIITVGSRKLVNVGFVGISPPRYPYMGDTLTFRFKGFGRITLISPDGKSEDKRTNEVKVVFKSAGPYLVATHSDIYRSLIIGVMK